MSVIGTYTDTNNPTFKIETFKMLVPQFREIVNSSEGHKQYEYFKEIANSKIFYSVFGTDWEKAMSYYIAHEMALVAQDSMLPEDSLQSIAGSVGAKGILNNYSVGGVYKSFGYDKTMVNKPNAIYFNSTVYGQRLMALYATKGVPCVLVATPE